MFKRDCFFLFLFLDSQKDFIEIRQRIRYERDCCERIARMKMSTRSPIQTAYQLLENLCRFSYPLAAQ